MRIDKFLKVSRVIKRRTVANEAADSGRISVNGKIVKASYEVKIGDIIEIKFGDKISKFQIIEIPKVQGKDMGELMFLGTPSKNINKKTIKLKYKNQERSI
ncbi:MAG: RNA-binding S4 domain-containing protein [Clostridia bacterium]|nr:RNA-binding S4 domain-containing protein [Clostridia bacterium]MBP3597814.1 RNA-binding S4 domain-containing protein [Clostridia bacterium]